MIRLEQLKVFSFGVIVATAVFTAIPTFADSIQKTITVSYNNIKIFVDGSLITPRDGAGKVVEPFVYEGTTYLPVRAVGEALGKDVDWDGTTQSVFIGGKPEKISYLEETMQPYSSSGYEQGSVKMAGKQYHHGITFFGTSLHALYNLDGKYSEISGIYGLTDNVWSGSSGTIKFYGDDKLILALDVEYGSLPKDFSVNVEGVLQLKIECEHNSNWMGLVFGLADVVLK